MASCCLQLRMELCSDTIFGSGGSVPGGEDIALRLTPEGRPLLPGATLKGLLRESVANLLAWTGAADGDATLAALFGAAGWHGTADDRRLRFGDLLPATDAEPESLFTMRSFTALENGLAKEGTLRTAACLRAGQAFTGLLFCDEGDLPLLQYALRGIKWAGMLRSRGFGRVKLTAARRAEPAPAPAVAPSRWLHYRLRLLTPLSVPWLARSGAPGEPLNDLQTRRLLPGSAVRGLVASTLAAARPAEFAAHKRALLGQQTRFLDALPLAGDRPVLPAPMGFYRDKAGTRFYSVLTRPVVPGDKRAGLGAFCRIEGDTLTPFTPGIEHATRIRRGRDKQIFTVDRLAAGTVLDGYIQLADPALAPLVAAAFPAWMTLGADRYAGSGLCERLVVEGTDAPAWTALGYRPGDAVPETLYMMLVTPTVMRRRGEPCGLDTDALARALGVERVTVESCATSLGQHTGYNRQWGCGQPVYPTYERGSVFRLVCTPAPTAEALDALQQTGLGAARGEGYGQVLFLRRYAELTLAATSAETPAPCDTAADRLRRARCRWLLETPLPAGTSASQLGSLQALCEAGDGNAVRTFLQHNAQERGAFHGATFTALRRRVEALLDQPLYATLTEGGLSPELRPGDCPDGEQAVLQLLCDWLDLSRKGDAKK